MSGLKFKYLAFNKIGKEYKGILVWIDGKEISQGSISEVLIKLSEQSGCDNIPNYEIVSTRVYFDIFVIELRS